MGTHNRAWFDLEIGDPDVGVQAEAATDRLESNQGWRRSDALRQYSTFFGRKIESLSDLDTRRLWEVAYDQKWSLPDQDISFSRTAIQTIISRIAAPQRPKPVVLTQGADYKTRLQARKRSKFLEGQFQESQGSYPTIYDLGLQLFWDACVTGGLAWIEPNIALKKVEMNRDFIWNLYFDEEDAKLGFPTQAYRKRVSDRAVLIARFPEHEQWICDAPAVSDSDHAYKGGEDRCVKYWECYVKAQGDETGRHLVLLGERVLLDEAWEHDGFPCVTLFFNRAPIGVRNMPPIEAARYPQLVANQLLRWMMENVNALAGGAWVAQRGSVDRQELSANDAAKIMYYEIGAPAPQFTAPNPFNQQVWQMFEWHKGQVLEAFNLSSFAVTGEVQPGVTSGIQTRNINQIQDMQFLGPARAYEQMFIDVGKLMLQAVSDLQKAGVKPESYLPSSNGFIERVEWDSIKIGEKSLYTVQVRAGSDNTDTFSGRQQFVTELFQMGRITPEAYQRLIQNPDTEAYQNREDGQYNWVERIICDILDSDGGGEIDPPDELMDLVAATMQMTKAYHEVSAWPDTPEDVRRAMRNWIASCVELINRANPPQQPQQPPPAGGPPTPSAAPPAGPNLGMN